MILLQNIKFLNLNTIKFNIAKIITKVQLKLYLNIYLKIKIIKLNIINTKVSKKCILIYSH